MSNDREDRPTVVWRCRGCGKEVGTDGEQPDECSCGHDEWKRMLDQRDYAEVYDGE